MTKSQYGDCTFCGGAVTERFLQKPCFWGEKLVAVADQVPTGVCEQCGERYYKAAVLKQIERSMKETKGTRHIDLPVIEYAA